jgi:dienelactone hydrolase
MPRVLAVGDAAAGLVGALAAAGVEATSEADGAYVVGIGGDEARAALAQGTHEGVLGVAGIDGSPPVDDAPSFRTPALVVVAEADADAARAFAQALTEAGVLHETVVYGGVERGFFGADGHPAARDDATKLLRRFIGVPA